MVCCQPVTSTLYCRKRHAVHFKECIICACSCALWESLGSSVSKERVVGGSCMYFYIWETVFLYFGNCISISRQLPPSVPWENPVGWNKNTGWLENVFWEIWYFASQFSLSREGARGPCTKFEQLDSTPVHFRNPHIKTLLSCWIFLLSEFASFAKVRKREMKQSSLPEDFPCLALPDCLLGLPLPDRRKWGWYAPKVCYGEKYAPMVWYGGVVCTNVMIWGVVCTTTIIYSYS